MPHFLFFSQGEQVLRYGFPCQSLKRKGSNKLAAPLTQHAAHPHAFGLKQPDQLGSLVSGNTAANDKQNGAERVRPCHGRSDTPA